MQKLSAARFLILLAFVVMSMQGCGQRNSPSAATEEILLSGTAPMAEVGETLIVRNSLAEFEAVIGQVGAFQTRVSPGTFELLVKSRSGSLKLIKQGVAIEDNLTINLLDVQLVPIPLVVSVAVPVVEDRSAIIEWETDIESDGRVDFGVDAGYGYSTFTDSALKTSHRVLILELRPQTLYHFRIVSSRHGLESVQSLSRDYQFVTESTP